MSDEYSKQQIHDKEKTELKAGSAASSDEKNPNGESLSPFARPVEGSPLAKSSESSPFDKHGENSTLANPGENLKSAKASESSPFASPLKDSNAEWPMLSKASLESVGSPYAKVYEGTPYAKLIEHVTGEFPGPASIENLAAIKKPDEPPDLGSDQYKILDLIGQGGMGSVYRAEDVKLQKQVAIKCIRPELATDQTALKRFYQECHALSQLNHPNIVAVYALHVTPSGAPYLVMDYIPGESLGSAIKNLGRMDVARSLSVFADICEALHYAHDRGVIHRDLKPNNILLSTSGSARVVDFGIAKVAGKGSGETVTGLTQMGDMFGTPAYMSPEQCEGEPLDVRSDIYSFGCVMFETLSGSPPFSEANPFKLMTKHVNEKAPSLENEGISRSLSNIVAKCLAKRPESRYQTVDQLMQDIVAVRNSKEPLNVRKKAAPLPKVKLTPAGLLKAGLVISMMVAVAYITLTVSHVPSVNNSLALVTGNPVVNVPNLVPIINDKIQVPIINVRDKPNIAKPTLEKPPAFPATPYVPIKGQALTDEQKDSYRKLLYNVTPTNKETLEPFLEIGKPIAPFLLDEIRSSDNTIARASSIILVELGPSVLPGLIEDLKVDSNRWIRDAIEQMGHTAVAALAPLLTDDDPTVRARAVATIDDAIGDNILPAKLSQVILWLAINDSDAKVREAASAALAQSPANPNLSQVLSYNAINDKSILVRTAAINALASVASREGDTSKPTLDIFGWVVQREPADSIKQSVFRTGYMREYGESLGPYLRGAYYTGSRNVQNSLFDLTYQNQAIGDAILPELIDSVSKNDVYGGSSALFALKSMKGRAKPALSALNATLIRRQIEHPREEFRFGELRKTIETISQQ